MDVYTIAEFRKNTRKALDQAETEGILLRRYDKLFKITLNSKEDIYVVPKKVQKVVIKMPSLNEQIKKVQSTKDDIKFCKHDSVLGFCKKGCR